MNRERSSPPFRDSILLRWIDQGRGASAAKGAVEGCGLRAERQGSRNGEIRIKEALSLGASVIATSCPFCLLTLEDAVKISGQADQIVVKDISELVAEAMDDPISNTQIQIPDEQVTKTHEIKSSSANNLPPFVIGDLQPVAI